MSVMSQLLMELGKWLGSQREMEREGRLGEPAGTHLYDQTCSRWLQCGKEGGGSQMQTVSG